MDHQQLCKKIQEIYPEIGECEIDVDVEYNSEKKAWVVHLEKDGKKLDTYLEDQEAQDCMYGKECVSLGLQVSQLVANIKDRPATRQTKGV